MTEPHEPTEALVNGEFMAIVRDEAALCLAQWADYCYGMGLPYNRPTAIGWKVATAEELQAITVELQQSEFFEQLHAAVVDGRLITSFVFGAPIVRDQEGVPIKVLKVLQRRPGSDDPTGLDHIDFFIKHLATARARLTRRGIAYEEQANDAHSWLSLEWAQGREAKFVEDTVLDTAAQEMIAASDGLLGRH